MAREGSDRSKQEESDQVPNWRKQEFWHTEFPLEFRFAKKMRFLVIADCVSGTVLRSASFYSICVDKLEPFFMFLKSRYIFD